MAETTQQSQNQFAVVAVNPNNSIETHHNAGPAGYVYPTVAGGVIGTVLVFEQSGPEPTKLTTQAIQDHLGTPPNPDKPPVLCVAEGRYHAGFVLDRLCEHPVGDTELDELGIKTLADAARLLGGLVEKTVIIATPEALNPDDDGRFGTEGGIIIQSPRTDVTVALQHERATNSFGFPIVNSDTLTSTSPGIDTLGFATYHSDGKLTLSGGHVPFEEPMPRQGLPVSTIVLLTKDPGWKQGSADHVKQLNLLEPDTELPAVVNTEEEKPAPVDLSKPYPLVGLSPANTVLPHQVSAAYAHRL